MKKPSKRSRVSYTKTIRQEAKAAGLGLITVSILQLDGTVLEAQFLADPFQCHFAKWMHYMLENVTPLPPVEQVYKMVESDHEDT